MLARKEPCESGVMKAAVASMAESLSKQFHIKNLFNYVILIFYMEWFICGVQPSCEEPEQRCEDQIKSLTGLYISIVAWKDFFIFLLSKKPSGLFFSLISPSVDGDRAAARPA